MQGSDLQEKINKRNALVLVALAGCIALLVWFNSDESEVQIDKKIFQVAETESVDRILLEKKNGKIDLRFNGSTWRVNEHFKADPNLLKVVMATLRQVEVKRPVADKDMDSISRYFEKEAVRVSIYAQDKLIKTFTASGNLQKTQAYFKTEGDDHVYLAHIPGYRVYVAGIFELPASGWRVKRVFDFNWRNFQALEMRYPGAPANNFRVSPQNNVFGIEGIQTDTTKLGPFMDAVFALEVDNFQNDPVLRDSLVRVNPMFELVVNDVARNNYSLKVYAAARGQESPGILNDTTLITINHQRLRSVIRPKSWFLKR